MSAMHLIRSGLVATASAIAAACLSLPPGAAHAAPFPVTTDVNKAIAEHYLGPATESPAGSNRWDCRDAQGRDPVILLHATAMNQSANWAYLAPTLANAGYCAFSTTYGQASWSGNTGGMGNKERAAEHVAAFLDRVLAATGASKVDLIGHSQGGAIAQLLTQLPGRADQVDTIVSLSATPGDLPCRFDHRPPARPGPGRGGLGSAASVDPLRQLRDPIRPHLHALPGDLDDPGPERGEHADPGRVPGIEDRSRGHGVLPDGRRAGAQCAEPGAPRSSRLRVRLPALTPPEAAGQVPVLLRDVDSLDSSALPRAARRPSSVGRAIHS